MALNQTTPDDPGKFNFEALSGCPLCGHASFQIVFDRKVRGLPLAFTKCDGCELVFQNPRMTTGSLQEYFSSNFFIQDSKTEDCSFDELLGYYDYATWDESYRKTAGFRLKNILKFKKPAASLLEIGSATGTFLKEARKVGFEVRGLDLSSRFAEVARKKGFEVDEGFIETYPLPAERYDVICNFGGITCWHDPLKGLSNIRQALKKDGIFALNHPDFDNFFYKIQGSRNYDYQHPCLTLWSEKTMHRTLQEAGFEVVFHQSERQYISLGRLFEYLRLPATRRLVYSLKISEFAFPFIVPFTKFLICRIADSNRQNDLGKLKM